MMYAILIMCTAFFVYPVLFVLKTSFESQYTVRAIPPQYLIVPTLRNYIRATTLYEFQRYLINSVVVTILSVGLALLLGTPCAYLISGRWGNKRRSSDIAYTIFAGRLLPPTAVAIPFFLLYNSVGLYDTQIGLILIYITLNLPFVIWLMRGFYMEIPKEIEEAAEVDGCSKLSVFLKIVTPVSLYGLAATALFCMLVTWNEFNMALILTGVGARTLPVQALQFWGSLGLDWGAMCAAAMLITSPVLVFGVIVRRYLIRGLTFGAVKG